MPSHRLVAALFGVTLAGAAVAQTPAPAAAQAPAPAAAQGPAPASTAPAAAEKECGKPDPHPGRIASNEKKRGWEKEVIAWQACMKKFIGELEAKADAAVKVANATVADSNATIAAYNMVSRILVAVGIEPE